jgi:curved DNA-binding protein CbpA
MPDYYEVLQVHPRADHEVIRAAYRTLARKYHPDLGGSSERMIALNDAWDVLGDPVRRAAYDASRNRPAPMPPSQAGASAAGGASGSGGAAESSWAERARAAGAERTAGAAPAGGAAGSNAAPSGDGPRAGSPPGNPSGTVLDFGRYAGWSLGEIARYDLDYLEWLQRATFGRRLRTEIDDLLRHRRGNSGGPSAGAASGARSGSGWRARR